MTPSVSSASSVPSVRVSARGAARVRAGHPWVIRSDVAPGAEPGADEVVVTDGRGRPLASALYAPPPSPIALRVYARGDAFVPLAEAELAERLRAAEARRREIFGADARTYRLCHGEADLLPGLFVDRYEDAAVVQTATAAMDRRLETVVGILAERHGIGRVVVRNDGSMRDHEALPREKRLARGADAAVRVREGAAVFELDLLEDAKTGGFLDQRENHLRAAELARGEALDAFAYHGGFALALAARASSVLALDVDARAVARARRNAELSGYRHVEVRQADAFVELRAFERDGRRFDVVVIDPPAFAKRRGSVPAALRAYHELNLRAMRILRPGGWLVTCSCSGKVTPALFEEMLVKAAADARRSFAVVERRGAGRDHPGLLGVPETEYLKAWFLRALD